MGNSQIFSLFYKPSPLFRRVYAAYMETQSLTVLQQGKRRNGQMKLFPEICLAHPQKAELFLFMQDAPPGKIEPATGFINHHGCFP